MLLSIICPVQWWVIQCLLQRNIWDIVRIFYKETILHPFLLNLKNPQYGISGGIDLLKRNSSESTLIYKAFVLRPTNVGQGLFLCGQQPSASSPVTLRFICTFRVKTTWIGGRLPRTPYRRHRCLRYALYRLREVPTARFISNCDWWSKIIAHFCRK